MPVESSSPSSLSRVVASPKAPVKKSRRSVSSAPKATPEALLKLVIEQLDDDKAENLVSFDLMGRTALMDYIVIATGKSARHLTSMAQHLSQKLEDMGLRLKIEGLDVGDWVLVDIGDVVVHLFREEIRELYQLERIWSPEALGPVQSF